MSQKVMYPAKINSPTTLLNGSITESDTTIPVIDISVLPDAPNLATMIYGSTAETILYSGISGSSLTGVTRAFQGEAKSWPSGTQIARLFTAYDHDTFRDNITDMYINGGSGTDYGLITEPTTNNDDYGTLT